MLYYFFKPLIGTPLKKLNTKGKRNCLLANHTIRQTKRIVSRIHEGLFSGLSTGGNIEVPIGDSSWDSYFWMFRDKFSVKWIVDFDPKYNGKLLAKNNECLIIHKTSTGIKTFAKAFATNILAQLTN